MQSSQIIHGRVIQSVILVVFRLFSLKWVPIVNSTENDIDNSFFVCVSFEEISSNCDFLVKGMKYVPSSRKGPPYPPNHPVFIEYQLLE